MRAVRYKTLKTQDGTVQLVKESCRYYADIDKMDMPGKVADFCRCVLNMDMQTEEYVYLFCMDAAMRLIGFFEISHGNIDGSYCGPREIFQKAFLCNAKSIFIVHNHPSGDTAPSRADSETFEKLTDAGNIMGIRLLDSIIIGGLDYYSFLESSNAA